MRGIWRCLGQTFIAASQQHVDGGRHRGAVGLRLRHGSGVSPAGCLGQVRSAISRPRLYRPLRLRPRPRLPRFAGVPPVDVHLSARWTVSRHHLPTLPPLATILCVCLMTQEVHPLRDLLHLLRPREKPECARSRYQPVTDAPFQKGLGHVGILVEVVQDMLVDEVLKV